MFLFSPSLSLLCQVAASTSPDKLKALHKALQSFAESKNKSEGAIHSSYCIPCPRGDLGGTQSPPLLTVFSGNLSYFVSRKMFGVTKTLVLFLMKLKTKLFSWLRCTYDTTSKKTERSEKVESTPPTCACFPFSMMTLQRKKAEKSAGQGRARRKLRS